MEKNVITGMTLKGAVLEWTSVRARKGQVEPEGRGEIPLGESEAQVDLASPDLAPLLKKGAAEIRGRVCYAVPSDQVLLRVVELPTLDPQELRSMVDLQVDKFSPFPVDQMQVSFEVLARKESATRVLIAAIRREIIERLGQGFGKAGLLPYWIDVDVLGWWYLLLERGAVAAQGRQVAVLMTGAITAVIVAQEGVPVVFRALGVQHAAAEEDLIAEVVEEVSYTLASLETEWGVAGAARLDLWAGPGTPAALAGRLGAECGLAVGAHKLEELPALSEGLARRAAARSADQVDLAPAAWRETEMSRKSRRAVLVAAVLFLVIWAAGLAAFVAGLNLQKAELEKLRAEEERLAGPAQEMRNLQQKVRSLEQYADRAHSAIECLREVSAVLPGGVDLASFAYKKGRAVNLRGEAARVEPVYGLIEALEKSELFTEIKTEGIAEKRRANQVKTEFRITAGLPGEDL
ncbi:MAG: pilus assembly protein PilM [Kiritimatiellae bacterium]|nr:pilus assembly protein PilM [Kiritimatiellia bacterium]